MDIEDEFIQEGLELLTSAEDALLEIEKGSDIAENYKIVFRSFHSLKGGAGMMGMENLQSHMHLLEDFYSTLQGKNTDLTKHSDYFLKGIDFAKLLLEGRGGQFDYHQNHGAESKRGSQEELRSFLASSHFKIVQIGEAEFKNNEILSGSSFLKEKDFKNFYRQSRWLGYDAIFTADANVIEFIRSSKIQIPIFYFGEDQKEFFHNGYNLNNLNDEIFVNLLYTSSKFIRSIKDLEKSLQIIMYQFVDLEDYLVQNGKDSVLKSLKSEIFKLVQEKHILTGISK